MEKKYQIFISSTYTDLTVERTKVFQILMELDCIPAGMELFPAIDNEQFEFIKRIIDDCDYYLLIIGGRYGTLSQDGISFTEKEYDYAISKGKRVLAFIHANPDIIPINKSEILPEVREKLVKFKEKVETGRLVRFWNTADELASQIATNLPKTIKTYPTPGWVRGDTVSNADLMQEVLKLREEKEYLLSKVNMQDEKEFELSKEAKRLLVDVSKTIQGRISISESTGQIILYNRTYVTPQNAKERAIWVEAIKQLNKAGLIEELSISQVARRRYIITLKGLQEAENILVIENQK
ncbi:DUF4062 domain-containing protein [Parafilimonas terrae]|uniref:DUF4062 domain-containing protein n=1 Tax=Parafilimonas terrae TaxID=1465490 RepID=A0A1I5UBT4_9BACT|nr:DUF4062 domain-containing protein [Parafilimonas terrae]SFP92704.1 protein of unknown function [Parafilimonas terrae]